MTKHILNFALLHQYVRCVKPFYFFFISACSFFEPLPPLRFAQLDDTRGLLACISGNSFHVAAIELKPGQGRLVMFCSVIEVTDIELIFSEAFLADPDLFHDVFGIADPRDDF